VECQECLGLLGRRGLASPPGVPRGWGAGGARGRAAEPGGVGSEGCWGLTQPLLSSAELSQVEMIRTYLAKQADELSLQQADVVLVLGGEDGECRRAGSCGGEG